MYVSILKVVLKALHDFCENEGGKIKTALQKVNYWYYEWGITEEVHTHLNIFIF